MNGPSTVPKNRRYVANIVLLVGLFLAWPLWREFHEPGQLLWNVVLTIFLIAIVVGAFLGIRNLQKHEIEVGEARFSSSDQADT